MQPGWSMKLSFLFFTVCNASSHTIGREMQANADRDHSAPSVKRLMRREPKRKSNSINDGSDPLAASGSDSLRHHLIARSQNETTKSVNTVLRKAAEECEDRGAFNKSFRITYLKPFYDSDWAKDNSLKLQTCRRRTSDCGSLELMNRRRSKNKFFPTWDVSANLRRRRGFQSGLSADEDSIPAAVCSCMKKLVETVDDVETMLDYLCECDGVSSGWADQEGNGFIGCRRRGGRRRRSVALLQQQDSSTLETSLHGKCM